MSKNSKLSVSKAEKLLFERVLSDVKPLENLGPFSSSGQEAVKIPQRTKNTVRKNLSTQTKSKPSQKPLFLIISCRDGPLVWIDLQQLN